MSYHFSKTVSVPWKMFDLQRQVIEKNVTAFNRYMGVLSDTQRAMWQNMRNHMLSGHGAMPR